MILKADISKTSTGRYLFLFIFMCGNSKCTRIQKIKNFSGEVNWVHQALKTHVNVCETVRSLAGFLLCNGGKLEEAEDFKSVFIVHYEFESK